MSTECIEKYPKKNGNFTSRLGQLGSIDVVDRSTGLDATIDIMVVPLNPVL
jgi:hypothetical protein